MDVSKSISSRAIQMSRFSVMAAVLLLCAGLARGNAAAAGQEQQALFATPEDASKALADAAKAKDRAALARIFGPDYDKLLSGDQVQDDSELEHFAAGIDKSAKLEKADDAKFTLAIGEDNWPFPIPIVKQDDKWRYDTKAGMEEILNRRIGENELSAIATCRAYVLAQWEYFTGDHDSDGVAEYAQKFISSPGQKDGLYWDTPEGEKPSPLGQLVAAARAEGYSARRTPATATATPATNQPRHPYHGYYFKILKRQGPHAPLGRYNYLIHGHMIVGYALIAYPDKWGSSGLKTFIVNQQGRVYEKNLGPNTAKIAAAITEYDPDTTWKPVNE